MVKFLNCGFCLAFSCAFMFGMATNSDYTRGLIKYLKEESKLYQVVFINDYKVFLNSSSSIDTLITDVTQHIPSLSISLYRMQYDLKKLFPPLLQRPRRTTLFVIIVNGNQNSTWGFVYDILLQLIQLSQGLSQPRCLINIFSQRDSHLNKQLLEYFWLRDFLDIAIMQHFPENEKSLALKINKLPILHEINPFAKNYSAQIVTTEKKWFKNKLLNLQGYPLKIVFGIFESQEKMMQYKKYKRLEEIFSKVMHCTVDTYMSNVKGFGQLLDILNREKAEIILNIFLMENLKYDPNVFHMRIVDFSLIKAVIPNAARFTKVIVISKEFIYMWLATIIAIGTIRITALMLKFDRNTWQTFNISQILIGLSIVREPEKQAERIVFGLLVLSCIVYSGYFYSVILDINFLPEPQIQNLEELANSSLTPIMHPFVKKALIASPVSYIRKLGTKSVQFSNLNYVNECLDYLSKYQNVTCITFMAEQQVNDFMAREEKFNGRILQDQLSPYYTNTWRSRHGSPFLDRFNEILLRSSEGGFLFEILSNDDNKGSRVAPPEDISTEKLLLIVFYLLRFGYTLATTVFFIEVISVISMCTKK